MPYLFFSYHADVVSCPTVSSSQAADVGELGPDLSPIMNSLQTKYESTSYIDVWAGIVNDHQYTDRQKSPILDNPYLLLQKSRFNTLTKYIFMVENTKKNLRSNHRGPVSTDEEELWSLLSILAFIFVDNIHPVVGNDCIHDGKFRLRKLSELKKELRAVYRLLKGTQYKTGCSNRIVEGILRRIWEQVFGSKKQSGKEEEYENMSPEDESLEEENVRKNDPIDHNKLDKVEAGFM